MTEADAAVGDVTVGDVTVGDVTVGDVSVGDSTEADSSGGTDAGVPLLERPATISEHCSATLAMTQVPSASWYPAAMATIGGGAYVAQASETLELTSLDASGALGTTTTIDATQYGSQSPDIAAAVGNAGQGGAGMVWKRQANDSVVRFARVGADGALVGAAVELEATRGAALSEPRIAAGADGGYAVVVGVSDGSQKSTLRVLLLDAAGTVVGSPRDLYQTTEAYSSLGGVVTAVSDGFAVVFSTGSYDGSEVFAQWLSADGAPRGEPRRVSAAGGGGWAFGTATSHGGLSVQVVGGELWAAWTEFYTSGDMSNPKGHGILRLAKLDEAGADVVVAVQAPVEDVQSSSPRLFERNGRLGLLWSSGTIIYICGGCVADDDLHVLLIDPATTTPASDVVTFKHINNGLVGPLIAPIGDDLLIGARLDFHALSAPAFGVMHCE